ncbi:MAG: DUF3127 domain-containing protein [Flavobacterium sp.]|nr:DUF3127 domain-containing protein [Pedobacter sp.]
MDIKGKVHEISSVIEVNEKFKKRELIVEFAENPQYPEYVKFEAQQDKVSMLDSCKIGDQVEVFFNLRGRPWTNKEGITSYFNNMVVWKINVLGSDTSGSAASSPEYAKPVDITASAEDDDLPF